MFSQIFGSSKLGGSTANNKEYLKIFPYKNYKILLNTAVHPRNLLDPTCFPKPTFNPGNPFIRRKEISWGLLKQVFVAPFAPLPLFQNQFVNRSKPKKITKSSVLVFIIKKPGWVIFWSWYENCLFQVAFQQYLW